MPEECLTDIELENWPNLPSERAKHHRGCRSCEEKVRGLARPRFMRAAESVGARRGVSAKEVLESIDDEVLDEIA